MSFRTCYIWLLFIGISTMLVGQASDKERVFVLTDISNEPDDEESMVRFLVYANEYDIEGLVATTSTWLREGTREDLIRRQIYAYGMVLPNLEKHQEGYPSQQELLTAVSTGQPNFGMAAVGRGKSTAGSRSLERAVDKVDDRPLWVSIWGGANTLAQTLFDVQQERSAEEVAKFVSKIKAYSISDQDDAGPWLRHIFPDLFYIVSPSMPNGETYHLATWTGISGDKYYRNGPGLYGELVENPWLEENIINDHGPLGALYPKVAYIMEGDTPSFLGLVENGLGWSTDPAIGGWGGRYVYYQSYGEIRPIWTNNRSSEDCVQIENGQIYCSSQATIWRWRKHYQHDFSARMDWTISEKFEAANHNPVAVLNGDKGRDIIQISIAPGQTTSLSADGSSDPDGDDFKVDWYIYEEAGNSKALGQLSIATGSNTKFTADQESGEGKVHIIMQIEDEGAPSLVSYRRVVIEISK